MNLEKLIRTVKAKAQTALRRAKKQRQPLGYYAWKPAYGEHGFHVNFGDDIFPKIASRILGREVELCPRNHPGRKLLLGGSIIGLAENDDLIWGAGVREGTLPARIERLTVLAVRGPLSAAVLRERGIDVPERFGDPAITLPLLYPEWVNVEKRWDVGIVPHFSDIPALEKRPLPPGHVLINPTRECERVLQEIAACRKIVASSLHGIICAETFGIPVSSFRTSTPPEPDFKYQDYHQGTGRRWTPAASLEEALNGPFTTTAPFTEQARALLACFPK